MGEAHPRWGARHHEAGFQFEAEGEMSKFRLSVVCLPAGFFGGSALGMADPDTVAGWVILAFACYVFGAIVLLVAGVVLTHRGMRGPVAGAAVRAEQTSHLQIDDT